MAILTYKINHGFDLKEDLRKALAVARFGVKNRVVSSKAVKHLGLKSAISNQILRKYAKNKKCKTVKSVNLIVPNQSIQYDANLKEIKIPCLNIVFKHSFPKDFLRINQIEISKDTIWVTGTVKESNLTKSTNFIGIDLNSTGHIAVAANPLTGKVLKLGKKAWHIRKMYKSLRSKLQRKKKFRKIRQIGNRESRIIRDLNHKISRKLVDYAVQNNCGIRLENLKGIRKNSKGKRSLSHNLNSWSFFQLKEMLNYKAKLQGVEVQEVAPCYTSQICSRTGLLGERNGDIFKSPIYGVESSHVNAAFNIALAQNGFSIDCRKRCNQREFDTPHEATAKNVADLKTIKLELSDSIQESHML